MGGGMGQPQQAPQAQPDPFDNPFGKVLKDMFGGAVPGMPGGAAQQRRAEPEPQSQNPWGDNPLGKIFEDMLKGTQGGGQAAPRERPAERPRQTESGRAKNPYDELFGEMFETGRKQRDEYQKGIESIFDQFTRGMDRHR
jgi:hypothetical protein